ncbi:MAG: hypothetical protein K9K81_05070 [Desulfobacteraceae bacterium]|nr:hypothetical protein [Desulfobacteraceae bacterium]
MNRMQYKQILTDAIQGEIHSQKFYQDAAGRMQDRFLKELFTRFTHEEKKHMKREHKLKMEQAFVDIGYPEVW